MPSPMPPPPIRLVSTIGVEPIPPIEPIPPPLPSPRRRSVAIVFARRFASSAASRSF